MGSGFGVQGLGLRVQGLGFRVEVLGLGVGLGETRDDGDEDVEEHELVRLSRD